LSFALDRVAMNIHGNADSHIDALCHVLYNSGSGPGPGHRSIPSPFFSFLTTDLAWARTWVECGHTLAREFTWLRVDIGLGQLACPSPRPGVRAGRSQAAGIPGDRSPMPTGKLPPRPGWVMCPPWPRIMLR
jgi:hypothetical protein